MRVEDIPTDLVAILNAAAGRQHSQDGPVLAALAEILTAFQERIGRDRDELRALFNLQWTRMGEATTRWRAEDPATRELIMPDLGSLLRWLMDDADRARTGARFIGRCGNESEPDGEVCVTDLYAGPDVVQVKCPRCGAWQGVHAPGRPTDPNNLR